MAALVDAALPFADTGITEFRNDFFTASGRCAVIAVTTLDVLRTTSDADLRETLQAISTVTALVADRSSVGSPVTSAHRKHGTK